MYNHLMTNARSILNKFNELQSLVAQHRPSIIGITESWLDDNICDSEIQLSGYNVFQNDCCGSRGRGVLLYIHNP